MCQLIRIINVALTFILLLYLKIADADTSALCPIGFTVAYDKSSKQLLCYSIKGPETYYDKFVNCAGNKFTIELYQSLNISRPQVTVWTDYKSMYDGGIFVDWSNSQFKMGHRLDTTYEVNRDPSYEPDETLCVVMDPITNFTAVRCGESHYRYCIVDVYSEDMYPEDETCDGLEDALKFPSPVPTCLMQRRPVRATWLEAKRICKNNGGSLLSRGLNYTNYFSSNESAMYPVGVVYKSDDDVLRYDTLTDNSMIPTDDWIIRENATFGAIGRGNKFIVNSSVIFYNIICEKPVELSYVELNLTITEDNKMILNVNQSLRRTDIVCFTDSTSINPTFVKISSENPYILKPTQDGYYWCTHIDTKNYHLAESNKVLYITVKESLRKRYAVQIRQTKKYSLSELEHLRKNVWTKILEKYVYYSNSYFKTKGWEDSYTNTTIEKLSRFYKDPDSKDVLRSSNVKRLYLDAKTVLLHVDLYPDISPARPGIWHDITIVYMKPVYFCEDTPPLPKLHLLQSEETTDCKIYTCSGDFNTGVALSVTKQPDCFTPNLTLSTTLKIDDMPTSTAANTSTKQKFREESSSEEDADNVTMQSTICDCNPTTTTTDKPSEPVTVDTPWPTPLPPKPTKPTKPTPPPSTVDPVITAIPDIPTTTTTTVRPEEHLNNVLNDLETLINGTEVTFADIDTTFRQVDNLLAETEVLDIPGRLLHLLDDLGAKINLNGSEDAFAVRENVALLVADANPRLPVRGIRIAQRDNDSFTDNAFEIIREDINETHFAANNSEVVLKLPESVGNTERRISFVVFRNDRAFQSSKGLYAVNSRILSVNVENITHFEPSEFVDIYLSPLAEVSESNQSRSCAYWQFLEDGSGGYWSQEGCSFIRAADGGLDLCRCDHLTHFAEVLVPRTDFSEGNENALNVISIVGCCLSIFGLVMVGVTAVTFRSWRRDFSNKIWLQLCAAILLLTATFLGIAFARFTSYSVGCMVAGVALHYAVLASFCWMVVAGVVSYRRLVQVFARDASHKLLRAAVFAWGAPAALVGVLLAAAPLSYAGHFDESATAPSFCYPAGLALWLAVYAPIAVMVLANWTLFALIVRSVFASRRIQRHGDSNEALRCASVSCLLVFLFGLPWIFGLFSFNLVAAYLFTIFASFQGFVLFLFFVLGNKKTRDMWLNKLKIKRTRKVPVTSSTYTNRSTAGGGGGGGGGGGRGRVAGPASIESKVSKPRSLSSGDDSRFS